MAVFSMERWHSTLRCFLCATILICWPASALADEITESCTNTASSTCPSVQRRVFADYAPDRGEDEEEDVDDADAVMHMQMRLHIDKPSDPKAEVGKTNTAPGATAKAPAQGSVAKDEPAAGQAAARPLPAESPPQQAAPASPAREPLLSSQTAGDIMPGAAGPSTHGADPVDPAKFLSGYQILFGAGIGALLVVVGAMLATALRTPNWVSDRRGIVSPDELKVAAPSHPSAKAWMLHWALGFDAESEDEVEPSKAASTRACGANGPACRHGHRYGLCGAADLQAESRPKKIQPPIHTASDSGDTDEEEPEAESDSGDLEDAVFVAQQVEVANEAMDKGYRYGPEHHTTLADVIQCDLR